MRLLFVIFSFLFCTIHLSGQALSGRVLDSLTKNPIAFANILYDSLRGVTTDIDGYFSINTSSRLDSVRVSYVGYQTKKVNAGKGKNIQIFLQPKTYQLDEVVVKAGANPALRIIENVIENKKNNSPKNYNTYTFKAYDKIIVTIHPDSLEKHARHKKNDTSFKKLKEFVEDQHFFISESVTKTHYEKPGKKHEEVIASRSSGFENPVFVVLISQLQSSSFYRDEINLLDKSYVSPIASRAVSKYNYRLRDTLFMEKSPDTTFIVSYSPRKGTNFDALKGMLHINSNGWALQNLSARPAKSDKTGVNIEIKQQYDLIDHKYWFPVQLSTEIFFGNVRANGLPLIGKGRRYVTEVSINDQQPLKVPRDIAVEILPDAFKMGFDSISEFRHVPITEKEMETYRVIDSVGKAENFDRLVNSMMTFTNGAIPFHFLNIPIGDLMDYNKYEGFYAGLGLETNEKFSRALEIGGYGGYGFKDKNFKYGAHATLFFDRWKRNSITYQYENDLKEPAAYLSDENKSILSPSSYRDFVVGRYDKVESHEATLKTHPFSFTDVELSLQKAVHSPTYDYTFTETPGKELFRFAELDLNVRFAFNEKFVKSNNDLISLGTNYPVINLKYIRGFEGLSGSDYSYSKWLIDWDHSFQSTLLGVTEYRINAGYLNKSIPYAGLFEGKGSYGKFAIYAPFSFSTMKPSEFLTDRFLAMFVSHNFRELLVKNPLFSPSISLHQNMMIGDLRNQGYHQNIDFSVPRKGYFESGIVFSNILKTNFTGLGLGFFYRYGPYRLKSFKNNLAINLSITFLAS